MTTLDDVAAARASGDLLLLFETAAKCDYVCWPPEYGPLPSRDQLLELCKAARAMQNPSELLAAACDMRDFFAQRVEDLEKDLASHKAEIADLNQRIELYTDSRDSACLSCFRAACEEDGTDPGGEHPEIYVACCNLCGNVMGDR